MHIYFDIGSFVCVTMRGREDQLLKPFDIRILFKFETNPLPLNQWNPHSMFIHLCAYEKIILVNEL